jgi:hypothetical protein
LLQAFNELVESALVVAGVGQEPPGLDEHLVEAAAAEWTFH